MNDEQLRWQYRFVDFAHAYGRMKILVNLTAIRPLTDIEQEALVWRFGVAWELAWKLLKDYLQYSGIVLNPITPRTVIRAAFEAKLITDHEHWFQALDARNNMAHAYNADLFQAVVNDIMEIYHPVFANLFYHFQKLSTTS